MPYKNIDELPIGIQKILLVHTRQIFLAAYNTAWEEYQDPIKRRGSANLEEVVGKVAWAAVKKEFVKDPDTGKWEPLYLHR